MKKVIVLGAGLVGAPMAFDLNRDSAFEVTIADVDRQALDKVHRIDPSIHVLHRNLSNPEDVQKLVRDFDYVLNAVPGYMGFKTAKAILQAGRDSVCIAFYEEDPFPLDGLAKAKNATMIMDCGICPGMNNTLIMDLTRRLDRTDTVITYVGGLPEIREWPSEYKAVFSPIDVIEEYTRPARYVENGVEVTRPALSDPEYLFFPKVGTLEAFNTDGLRTMAKTLDAPNMKEKTLRYPGHIEKMTVLRELGFFSKEKTISADGTMISPLEMTAQVLFPNWQLKPGEADITVLKTIVEGEKNGKNIRYSVDLHDRYDPETDVISMARTTGYTATMALRMIEAGLYKEKGIFPPEMMGKHPECVDFLMKGLKERGINYEITEETFT
jgi:lysine 6-dehydrogenase